jgi:transcriptional regulator with XRE-family HTH domain
MFTSGANTAGDFAVSAEEVPRFSMYPVVTRQKAADRGKAKGLKAIRSIGEEIRQARQSRGLSMKAIGAEAGITAAEVSRIERAEVQGVSLVMLARLCAVVGLDLGARAYPGGVPVRDARHARLLEKLHQLLNESLKWSLEVPLPNPGDQRAWDAVIGGGSWRYGVEAELNPTDGQALVRRLHLKQRDGAVDGVILLLTDTRQTRAFRRELAAELAQEFPVTSRVALERLANGLGPGGNALVIL